jgi:hypothetical protein
MSAEAPEPTQPPEGKQAKRPSFCRIPYSDWISWDPLQSQSQTWNRLGTVATITIALGLLWIVWVVWPTVKWVKPGETEMQMKEDRGNCHTSASEKDRFIGTGRGFQYSAAYKTCMESKGYSLTKQK